MWNVDLKNVSKNKIKCLSVRLERKRTPRRLSQCQKVRKCNIDYKEEGANVQREVRDGTI